MSQLCACNESVCVCERERVREKNERKTEREGKKWESGCLYGNKLTLEKMRQNPINTAAGKSRKTPWDSQWPTHPRTHAHRLWYSSYKPLQVVNLKSRRNPSGWVIEVTPWRLQNYCRMLSSQEDEPQDLWLYYTLVRNICSTFELYSGLLLYSQGASGWPRLYLTHSGTEKP